jgi:hypothetical protein
VHVKSIETPLNVQLPAVIKPTLFNISPKPTRTIVQQVVDKLRMSTNSFFLRRSKTHLWASEYSMIQRYQETRILGKEGRTLLPAGEIGNNTFVNFDAVAGEGKLVPQM